MITTRQRKILRRLINNGQPESGKILASKFEITDRTLRNDIKSINEYLKNKNVSIQSNPRYGYWINNAEKIDVFDTVDQKKTHQVYFPNTSEEREIYIYFRLLLSNKPVSINELANEIYISNTTIVNDVAVIKDLINCIDGIELKINKNAGMKITGHEHLIRKLIVTVIFYYYDLCANYITNCINVFGDEQLFNVYYALINSFSKQNYILIQKSLKKLAMEIVLFGERKRLGYELTYMPYNKNPNVKLPLEDINRILKSDFNKYDLDVIYENLKYKKPAYDSNTYIYESKEHKRIIELYLNKIYEIYGIDLHKEKKLIAHLNKTLQTSDIMANRKEIDIADIKKVNPLAYEMALLVIPIFKKEVNYTPTEFEIERLSLRIGSIIDKYLMPVSVIINTGSSTYSEYLKYSLKKYFPKTLNIIGAFETYQIPSACIDYNVDLILSTLPFEKNDLDVDVIFVSPILQISHITMITDYINAHQKLLRKQIN